MIIKCLIIDDEPLAQDLLVTFVSKVNFLSLVGKCENANEALEVLQQEQVDLIFCDIQMPGITGIEFIKSLKSAPQVIFTTAFDNFAVEGFNVDALDYLMKPIAFDRFLRSVNKAQQVIEQNPPDKRRNQDNCFFVKEDYKLIKINFDDIFYIEGMKDYVKIITQQRVIVTHITIKKLEELLPAESFMRTHKSFIVRFEAIKAINGNVIEMLNNLKVPIGLKHREKLMKFFNNIN